jgi:hypothetical protein
LTEEHDLLKKAAATFAKEQRSTAWMQEVEQRKEQLPRKSPGANNMGRNFRSVRGIAVYAGFPDAY